MEPMNPPIDPVMAPIRVGDVVIFKQRSNMIPYDCKGIVRVLQGCGFMVDFYGIPDQLFVYRYEVWKAPGIDDIPVTAGYLEDPTDTPQHAEHYRNGSIEPWHVIDDWGLDFYAGNIVKYLCRMGKKPGESSRKDAEKVLAYAKKLLEGAK